MAVNEKKTRECRVPDEPFTFLGFTFGRQVSWRRGRASTAPAPAKKNVQGVCKRIHEETSPSTTWREIDDEVSGLNQILMGWGNYFCLGDVTGAWRVVDSTHAVGSAGGCDASTLRRVATKATRT